MKDLLPVVLVVCLLLAAALAAAVGVVYWLSFAVGPPTAPPGKFLVYEIDPTLTADPASVDLPKLIAATNQRINPGWSRNARIRPLENRLIEIAVFGDDQEKVQRIERLLEHSGTLEFRVLANQRDHEQLIEQARRESGSVVRDAAGKPLAWWVPVQTIDAVRAQQPTETVTRAKNPDGPEGLEVLVVADEFNVNGAYLKRAASGQDQRGQPCILLELDREGASRFGNLTANNLPDPASGFSRKLGIILNGRLYAAPAIHATITDRAEISGSFTQEEVEELVQVFNSGPLPAAIRRAETAAGPVAEAAPEKAP